MKLKALSLSDLEQVRLWRNEQVEMLRTPFLLAKEQQEDFYRNVVCNRQTNARYWGIWVEDTLIGMSGIEKIQWENRLGEISLLINPAKMEHWENALYLILCAGFRSLNMNNIYTEVYECSHFVGKWKEAVKKYDCITATLPARKYSGGFYYDSLYINFKSWGLPESC